MWGSIEHEDSNETILHIIITARTADEMRTVYIFAEFQNQSLTELLAEQDALGHTPDGHGAGQLHQRGLPPLWDGLLRLCGLSVLQRLRRRICPRPWRGAHARHTCCDTISWDEVLPGDLIFYPEDSHMGIVGGRDENGDQLIIRCAFSQNNVVITAQRALLPQAAPALRRIKINLTVNRSLSA